ncbi:MAG: hypothetical protein HRF49_06470 [bacterium]|jgi:hypothetical protein
MSTALDKAWNDRLRYGDDLSRILYDPNISMSHPEAIAITQVMYSVNSFLLQKAHEKIAGNKYEPITDEEEDRIDNIFKWATNCFGDPQKMSVAIEDVWIWNMQDCRKLLAVLQEK